jgi:hypothetical protein
MKLGIIARKSKRFTVSTRQKKSKKKKVEEEKMSCCEFRSLTKKE